jgi:putative NADPH-quinone reductase
MNRMLVVFAHPCEEIFAATLKGVAVGTVQRTGRVADLCDLYAFVSASPSGWGMER